MAGAVPAAVAEAEAAVAEEAADRLKIHKRKGEWICLLGCLL